MSCCCKDPGISRHNIDLVLLKSSIHSTRSYFLSMLWNSAMWRPGGWINTKMPSYQYRKSHCGDKTILWPSYLHNGISYTGKMTSLYWIRVLVLLRYSIHSTRSHFISMLWHLAMWRPGLQYQYYIYWCGNYPPAGTAVITSSPQWELWFWSSRISISNREQGTESGTYI